MSDRIPLPLLSRELAQLTSERRPRPGKLWEMVVAGDLPAEQVGGRWFVERADLPAIVKILRTAQTARPAPKRVRYGTSPAAA
jgi:hypothetical protein